MKPRINTNAYADMNKVKQDYNDMAAVVDSVEIKGATRYEKVKFIHDFICKRVEYDESLKYLPHMSLRAYFDTVQNRV